MPLSGLQESSFDSLAPLCGIQSRYTRYKMEKIEATQKQEVDNKKPQ